MQPFSPAFLFCLIAAGVLVWIIRKLIFEKNHVPVSELECFKDQLGDLKTTNAVAENVLQTVKEEYARTSALLQTRNGEVEKLRADLSERTAEKGGLELDVIDLKVEIQGLKAGLEMKSSEIGSAQGTISRLTAELAFHQERLETQKGELENIGARFENQFKVLADAIMEDKSQKFTGMQEAGLKAILQPLKENIQSFKAEFESRFNKESDERVSLSAQVALMLQLNNSLSEQANNLTQALRGNVKQQGLWGEMILESILEYSGLQKNRQYFLQEHHQGEEDRCIRPDVIVRYPDSRSIVIDSKVSLLHYERFCAADAACQEEHVRGLLQSIKAHIDGLAAKGYNTVKDALDHIVLFVPVEGAYITAMNADPELWQYASRKGILLISPTNLILALKLVKEMWQKDAIDRNAEEIAKRAGKLYDKLAGFVETFEAAGKALEKAAGCWKEAKGQLHAGRGNLISQAEQIKRLHVRSSKSLPQVLVEEALLEDGIGEIEE